MPGSQSEITGVNGVRVKIQSPSDHEKDDQLRLMWGDYWVKKELERALTDLGLSIVEDRPEVILQLFGAPPREALPSDTINLVWLYSHPDWVTGENLKPYRKIFCASHDFTFRLEEMGYENVACLPACTAKKPVETGAVNGVIFLGNARLSRPDGRKIVRDILETGHPFKVWGNLWDTLLPREYYGGMYWEYDRLSELYASSGITLNDHHPDMSREGFVSNKVFDILAGGGFCLSSPNSGLNRLFGRAVPQYESVDHLRELVDYYLTHEEDRQRLMAAGRQAALGHTYHDRALCFARCIRDCL